MMFDDFSEVMGATLETFMLASATLFVEYCRNRRRHGGRSVAAAIVLACLPALMVYYDDSGLAFVITLLVLYAVHWTYPVVFVLVAALLFQGFRRRNFWMKFAGFFVASLLAVSALDKWHWRMRTGYSAILAIWLIAWIDCLCSTRRATQAAKPEREDEKINS
jgi:hypothetical protein